MLTFAQTRRGKDPSPCGEPRPQPLETPLVLGRPCGEPWPVTHTPLHNHPRKPPQNHSSEGVIHEISTPGRRLRAGGNPLTKAKKSFAQQGNLSAQLTVVAHLSLDLGAGVNDGGVVTPTQGGADAHERGVGLLP